MKPERITGMNSIFSIIFPGVYSWNIGSVQSIVGLLLGELCLVLIHVG